MGRSGNALVFLLPTETAYIQYMNISQKVTLRLLGEDEEEGGRQSDETNSSVLDKTMEMLSKERLAAGFNANEMN